MMWLLGLWLIAVGLATGALVERYRWVMWAHRNHPEQAERERLGVL
jgi:hypothetical protein